jgi:hypothetical protein
MDRPVHQLAEWDHIELAYGPPTNADLTVAAALGRDGANRLQFDGLHDGTVRVRSRASVGVVRLSGPSSTSFPSWLAATWASCRWSTSKLDRAPPPVLRQGGAVGATEAASDRLGRHHWQRRGRRGLGNHEGISRWIKGGPAAAQELGGLAGVGVQEPLELLGVQCPHGQPGALVDGAAVLVVLVLVAVDVLVVRVVGVLVLAHLLLPSASALRRRSLLLAGWSRVDPSVVSGRALVSAVGAAWRSGRR